jgi:hypothetical protein
MSVSRFLKVLLSKSRILRPKMVDLPDEAKTSSERPEVSLFAVIHNGGAGPTSLSVVDACVKGRAGRRPLEVALAHRKERMVQMSGVTNAFLSAGGRAMVATVLPAKAQ